MSYKNVFEFSVITKQGQSRLIKPGNIPDIPEDTNVDVFVDGRKVWQGDGNQFKIDCDGLLVQLAKLEEDQTVTVRYYA